MIDLDVAFQELEQNKIFIRDVEKELNDNRDNIVNCDIYPHIPSGWSLRGRGAKHRKGGMVRLERREKDLYANGRKVELFLAKGQLDGIVGHQLCRMLAEKPVLNANILDYLYESENQHLIPKNWKGKCVYFLGDVYYCSSDDCSSDDCSSDDHLFVRYLYWDGDRRWRWGYCWLGCVFGGDNLAAVFASQALGN